MKLKYRLKNLISLIAIFTIGLMIPTKSYAQVCVDMLDYFNPTSNEANLISSGERFYNASGTVMGMPGFYIVKNATGEVYEEFAYDDQFIYHLRDTSWATENGNVQCEGFDAGFTMVRGNVDPATVDLTNYPPAPWVERHMCEGDVMNSGHTIVGFKKDGETCSQCSAPFTGYTSFAMKFNRHYDEYEVGGSLGTIQDVIEIQILEGNGAGERFLFSRQHGWIGFGRSSSITAKITATGPKGAGPQLCTLQAGGFASGDMCVGPVNVDLSVYRGQVIGHQDPSPDSKGPWKIYASATDDKEDSSDLVSSVIVDRMTITPSAYWHTDFSTVTQKFIGSLSTTSDDYINNKAMSITNMDTIEPRSAPLYLVSHIPGYIHAGGLDIAAQEEKREGEDYRAFQARAYPSQDGAKPGEKSTIDSFIDNNVFKACLQAAVCDPRLETCLKNDKSGDYCGPTDDPRGCIGVGRILNFQMSDSERIELLEPQDLQPMDKVLWDFSTAIARKPGDSVPAGRSDILATSLEDYYAQEQERILAAERKANESILAVSPIGQLPKSNGNKASVSETIQNANPVNPKPAYAQTPPYEQNQPYCQGAHILIENKTAENQYSVKIWNGQPDCPQPVDWGYYVEYWVSDPNTGQSQQISTCGSPSGGNIHRSYGLPIYQPGTADEREWGVPVETLPGCSIPVTPSDLAEQGLELKVHFQITNSSAPASDNPACTQRPMCTCPDESSCGIKDASPPPPIDCTKCETWAPSGECATMVAEDLLEGQQCAKGFCQINNGEFRLADNLDDPPEETRTVSIGDLISNILAGIFQGGAKLFNYHCEKDSECVSVDPATGQCLDEDESWSCTFGERQYLMYGYVPSRFKGKLNQFRTGHDFLAFQAMYKVPGVSDSYFQPKPSKHELELTLGIGTPRGNVEAECDSGLGSRLGDLFGLGGDDSCIDLAISGDDSRSMYIEYIDHYSQAAQYCLGEAAGSLPNQFPTRPLENGFCAPFMASLRGGSFLSGAPGGNTSLDSGTIGQIEEDSLSLGVPARLLATILEIEGGNQHSCFRPNSATDTGTGPYQITDLTLQDVTTPEEREQWNLQSWPVGTPQSIYREDGRCDFDIATQLAARVLKLKAGLDYRSGTISESNFNAIRDSFNGYYGEINGYCGPTSDTEGRWGAGISYCDYGLWRMGLTQYCENGALSPSCDNVGGETVNETETQSIANNVFKPIGNDKIDVQEQFLTDVENLLTKYSKDSSFSLDSPVDKLPKGFMEELEDLEEIYKAKYNL